MRGSTVPTGSASIVMHFSTGQAMTHRLQATHAASITSKTRPSRSAIDWWDVSSQAA